MSDKGRSKINGRSMTKGKRSVWVCAVDEKRRVEVRGCVHATAAENRREGESACSSWGGRKGGWREGGWVYAGG